ncbi:hypothetical protein BDZ94DRAFT_1199056 [Collybia nuda]|uniref:NmrA-like domain-containing protein n=1 Tax=Collybia nuda TaxID=64659 RepID=A0A9P5XZ53_9AGAR|nr:hypothetical protein BDZ94DRAFT_1199056 [Collybia nuda]
MTILLVGGTGTTGKRLTQLLQNANYSFLIASRSPEKLPEEHRGQGVKFDWNDPTTFENPFKADTNIDRVYLICAVAVDRLAIMKPWIDLAVSKGVKRIVLVSASVFPYGGESAGAVHKYIAELGIDYCVLRPTWFMENFSTQFYHAICENNEIATSALDGRVALVSVDDIMEVAFRALVDEKSHNTDHVIVGPELLSYDEAVGILSEVIGRKITHRHMPQTEAKEFYMSFGIPEDYALMLIGVEGEIANGNEEAQFHRENKIVGETHIRDFFQTNRDIWIRK